MRGRKRIFAAIVSVFVLSAAVLAGCSSSGTEVTGTAVSETGILTLSVNPEIQLEYNKEGKVVALTGVNEDGKEIVASYQDYIGKDCSTVLKDLIGKINEAGYFVQDVDGNDRNIVIQLEPGSVLPDENFLTEIGASTRDAVKNLRLASGIVTIGDSDYDPAYMDDGKTYITLEKAQEIALTQAGVAAKDAVFKDRDFDFEHGSPVYELEFTAGGTEYEYDIDASTGKILKAEHEKEDTGVTDYSDYSAGNVTDYGVSDYTEPAVPQAPVKDAGQNTDYGVTNYSDYSTTNYSDYGATNYSDYSTTNYSDYSASDYAS